MLNRDSCPAGLLHMRQTEVLPPRCHEHAHMSAKTITESNKNVGCSPLSNSGSDVESQSLLWGSSIQLGSEDDNDDAFQVCTESVQTRKSKQQMRVKSKIKPHAECKQKPKSVTEVRQLGPKSKFRSKPNSKLKRKRK